MCKQRLTATAHPTARVQHAVLPDFNKEEIARYSRHLIMPEVGMDGQRKLKAASVLLIGAGGLGSPLGLYLAAAGVGRIGLVDFDVVDYSNLQRQVIHGRRMSAVPSCNRPGIVCWTSIPSSRSTPTKPPSAPTTPWRSSKPYDIIIDGTDNFPTRYLANDASVLLGKPNVYGSIFRFEGQASVFFPEGGGPCYRCLYPEPPPPGWCRPAPRAACWGFCPGSSG